MKKHIPSEHDTSMIVVATNPKSCPPWILAPHSSVYNLATLEVGERDNEWVEPFCAETWNDVGFQSLGAIKSKRNK